MSLSGRNLPLFLELTVALSRTISYIRRAMKDMTDADQQKIQRQHQFVERLHALMLEYPEHRLYGDRNGDVVAVATTGQGLSTKSHSTKVTYQGRPIK